MESYPKIIPVTPSHLEVYITLGQHSENQVFMNYFTSAVQYFKYFDFFKIQQSIEITINP